MTQSTLIPKFMRMG